MLLKIIEEFKPTYIVACYDLAEPTYRHDAYDGYKAGRVKTDEALVAQINRSRDIFAAFGIPIFEKAGFEADDMLGTIAHLTKTEKNLTVIIASGDMDTLQCVDGDRVQVYTLKKGIKDTILYNQAAVVERFGFSPKLVPDYKGLRGDPSDNIPGIVGIGEKTATTLVTTFGSIDAIYKKLKKSEQPFLEAGLTPRIIGLLREGEEDAQFSKMLATIRTDAFPSFDYTTTHWRDQADVEAIFALFSELGFRTVTERVRKLFAVSEAAVAASVTGVTARAHQEAAILLWLLESERTNASIEDILDYGRSFLKTDDWASTVAVLEERVKAADLWELYEPVEKPQIAII